MRTTFTSVVAAATLLMGAGLTGSAAATTLFTGDYDVALNGADPGLAVAYGAIVSDVNGLGFSLDAGQSTAMALFNLYTNEKTVNGDDFASSPIQVAFNFTLPTVFGGAVSGTTQGWNFLGILDQGSVTWANGGTQVLAFGNGGQLQVHLNDAIFNKGKIDLKPGPRHGAQIDATFTLISDSAAVPEPGAWALMITGFGLAGATLRRRRTVAA